MPKLVRVAIIIVPLVVLAAVAGMVWYNSLPENISDGGPVAYRICLEQGIRQSLIPPDAEIQDIYSISTHDSAPGYSVHFEALTKNRSGWTIETFYSCVVQYVGSSMQFQFLKKSSTRVVDFGS